MTELSKRYKSIRQMRLNCLKTRYMRKGGGRVEQLDNLIRKPSRILDNFHFFGVV